MKLEQYISVDPNICHGKLCFKGTRIMVYLVLDMLEAGETPEQILKTYPTLTTRAIRAIRHLIEDRSDARALKRAIRTSQRKAGLSSIASRAKGRAPSLQSIVREVHAYRRAKRTP